MAPHHHGASKTEHLADDLRRRTCCVRSEGPCPNKQTSLFQKAGKVERNHGGFCSRTLRPFPTTNRAETSVSEERPSSAEPADSQHSKAGAMMAA